MNRKKVLISGASIAGPTLAYWLQRYGFEVTVVERSPALRLGGQNIDVRGAAQKIAQKMGIENAIREANTTETGLQFVNEKNEVKAAFPSTGNDSFTSELEILRGDLVNILYDNTKNNVTYKFGDHITEIKQINNTVIATFASGAHQTFDLLIAADGFRSRTRGLIFGEEAELKYLGLYTVYITLPKQKTDTQWARWYNAPDARVFLYRPDNKGTTRASLAFRAPEQAYEKLSLAEKKTLLLKKLEGAGWESARMAEEIERTDDFYFDSITQVKAPRWSAGRCAMIGDAAYCPTPITGMGTALAMVGAYLLAGELAIHQDHTEAFAAYEKQMRPCVESAQKLPPGVPWIVYPKSKFGVAMVNAVAGLFASKPVQFIGKLFSSNKKDSDKDEITLPDYESWLNRQ